MCLLSTSTLAHSLWRHSQADCRGCVYALDGGSRHTDGRPWVRGRERRPGRGIELRRGHCAAIVCRRVCFPLHPRRGWRGYRQRSARNTRGGPFHGLTDSSGTPTAPSPRAQPPPPQTPNSRAEADTKQARDAGRPGAQSHIRTKIGSQGQKGTQGWPPVSQENRVSRAIITDYYPPLSTDRATPFTRLTEAAGDVCAKTFCAYINSEACRCMQIQQACRYSKHERNATENRRRRVSRPIQWYLSP